jgi:hypothetical protein
MNDTEAPDAPAATVVLSRDQRHTIEPPGSPRSYIVAPLTRRDRNLFRRDMVAAGATNPGQWQLFDAMRAGLREIEPDNLEELLAVLDEAEALPLAEAIPADVRDRLAPIEAASMSFPAYAALVAAREFWWATMPTMILRRALVGWSGPDLPPFKRRADGVSDALLESIPDADLGHVGGRAFALAFLPADKGAEKN